MSDDSDTKKKSGLYIVHREFDSHLPVEGADLIELHNGIVMFYRGNGRSRELVAAIKLTPGQLVRKVPN